MKRLRYDEVKVRCLSILNGVIGDRLEEWKSGLAIRMAFYAGNKPLSLSRKHLSRLDLPAGGRICILAHGSCNSERDWGLRNRPSKDYGSLLRAEVGLVPFYLRYNSGLHISANGKRLSRLLERLVHNYPGRVSEIVLIGHSMGGLIFRSACHYGAKEKRSWVGLARKIFYLGSPHCGTHFEKFGKFVAFVLDAIPTVPTKIIASLIEWRSAGIKDLRHGYITHEDSRKRGADGLFYLHRHQTPLLETADHYLICGTLSRDSHSKMGRWFGDGLVHPGSGLGRGLLKSSRIPFLENHCKVLPGVSHYGLIKSMKVYRQIKAWYPTESSRAAD